MEASRDASITIPHRSVRWHAFRGRTLSLNQKSPLVESQGGPRLHVPRRFASDVPLARRPRVKGRRTPFALETWLPPSQVLDAALVGIHDIIGLVDGPVPQDLVLMRHVVGWVVPILVTRHISLDLVPPRNERPLHQPQHDIIYGAVVPIQVGPV